MKKQLLLFATSMLAMCSFTSCTTHSKLTIVRVDQSSLGEFQKELGVSIGIQKGNTDLETKLNNALATLDITTRNKMMDEAVDRAAGIFNTTETTPATLLTDPSLPVLRIGLECDYQPFNWTEIKENQYTVKIQSNNYYAEGYDIQVARYLCHKMNYRLEVYQYTWEGLIPALKTGAIDAVIAGMTDNEERRQSIDFSAEYFRSELCFVVKEGSPYASATKLSDFAGARIVSQIETVTDDAIEYIKNNIGCRHLSPLTTFATCALAVRSGNADAMTAELPVARAIVNSSY